VTRDLRPLFEPRSVAVLGASNDAAKWGHWLARGALQGEHRRAVYLVNRNAGEVLGRAAYASVADLPEPPELVVLAVPASGFEQAVEASLDAGARALVGITAGLGESGVAGRAREQAVARRVRERGAVLLGPNCLGLFDAASELQLASNSFAAGSIGVISQSGNLAIELGLLAAEVGLGFSRFVSVGNQADLEVAELVAALAAHEPTKLIALYCEDFRDGRAFARAAAEAGKPVVLLSAGGTAAGARAARSHTGALVSDEAAVEAACRAAGILRVRTPGELVDLAQALLAPQRPRGRRLAVLADGGGHGVVAAELVSAAGLELPALSRRLAAELARALPPTAVTGNPIDVAGGGEQDVSSFETLTRLLLTSGEVDGVLLTGYFGGYSEYAREFVEPEREVAAAMARTATESGRPLFVHTMYWSSAPARELRAGDVPVYRTIESAVGSVRRLVEQTLEPPSLRGVPGLPERAAPLASAPGYWEARDLVARAGIRCVEARRVLTRAEVRAAAADVGYPVALKATGALHKSDTGGVVLGLADEAALDAAFARLETLASEWSVEAMAPLERGVELIVGVRRDLRFGPIVLVGLGGIYAELFADVAVALAPLDAGQAEELLRSLACAPLLLGARGRPAVDLGAAARAAAALSRLAAAHPEIDEIEINPLLATPREALALDARVVLGERKDAE
jgi:acyl-CoA synthetase (NDP forming)